VCCFELVCVGMSCVEVMSRMEVSLLGVCICCYEVCRIESIWCVSVLIESRLLVDCLLLQYTSECAYCVIFLHALCA